ncbi:PASTA domain-containing protein [Micromonospora sp. NPDC051006]|uniref:PASTA domain-containing protein n=1 Tax=Micromonospora sp. NPDC051006 TaxID=3364283 RepID=UPI00378C6358
MTDGNTGGQFSPGDGDGRPGRMAVVLGGGLAAVLLAALGATGGWLLAGEDDVPPEEPAAATSPTAGSSSPTAPRPTATRSTPSAPRTSASTGSGLTVPPVIGTDFEDARDELHERRLSWRLVFGTGSGRTVERTEPAVGAAVKRGTTVTLYVSGPAPTSTVPDLVGDDCSEAAEELGEEGLFPRYPTGRSGTIQRQEPAADAVARWNDTVQVFCGAQPDGPPSGSPAP